MSGVIVEYRAPPDDGEDRYHVPWWRFWNMRSGLVGGFIAGWIIIAIGALVAHSVAWWAALR